MKKLIPALVAAATFAAFTATAAQADWKPAGPITFNIAFKAGGGTDTQARLIGEELAAKKGWTINYKNITGKGGSNLARALKDQKSDGLSLGFAVTTTFSYIPLISKKAGYTSADFDYIVTTAPTQIGVVVRADSGWKTMDDMIAAAKGGTKLKFSIMDPRLGDAAYLIGKKYGVKFSHVKAKGGRGVLNGLMAKDVDVGFIAGIHVKGVKSGELVNLASAEADRLKMSPEVPTLRELGIPYDFGITFVMFAPKGLPDDAKKAISEAVASVMKDENSKARKFVARAFGTPPLKTGAALDKQIADELEANKAILATLQ